MSYKKRNILAAGLILGLLFQQTLKNSVHASEISGITGNNGIFNIAPSDIKGDMGFRKYENFTLSKGILQI